MRIFDHKPLKYVLGYRRRGFGSTVNERIEGQKLLLAINFISCQLNLAYLNPGHYVEAQITSQQNLLETLIER